MTDLSEFNEFREVTTAYQATQLCKEGWKCVHIGEVDIEFGAIDRVGLRRVLVYVIARWHLE